MRAGRKTQVLPTVTEASPGDSLNLTIDTKEQQYAEKALKWAHERGRHASVASSS